MTFDNTQALAEGWTIENDGTLVTLDDRYAQPDHAPPIDARRGLRRHLMFSAAAGSAYHKAAILHLQAVNIAEYENIVLWEG